MSSDNGSERNKTVYFTVTLAYDVLVAGLPGEDPRSVARRAIEQEVVRTGESPRAVAVDGQPLPSPVRGRPPA